MRARADARGHVELRGPTWWLRRWVTVTDPETGAQRREYRRERLGPLKELRTQAAARAAADEWIERTRPEPRAPGPQIMAVSYLTRFDRVHIPLMRPSSQAVYRSVIRKHIRPALSGQRLVDIDTAWLNRFVGERAARMQRKTLINIRHIMLQILHTAVKDRYGACRIDTRDVRVPRVAGAAKPQRYFKADELVRIIDGSEFPQRAIWALMGYAGLRAGEACALTWEDIDFGRHFLTVRQNAVRGAIGAPKTASSAGDVPVLPVLEQILIAYLEWLVNNQVQADLRRTSPTTWQAPVETPAGLLFRSRTGAPWRADDLRRRRLYPLLERLGLPKAGLHAFRHSVPRLLAAQGVSMDTIRKVMRHRSTEQTEVYLHTSMEDVWASLEKAGLGPAQTSAALLPTRPLPRCAPEISRGVE